MGVMLQRDYWAEGLQLADLGLEAGPRRSTAVRGLGVSLRPDLTVLLTEGT